MFLKIGIFFLLLAHTYAETSGNNKENVYYYEGFVSFDTTEPIDYTSYTVINADVHVLKNKNDEYWMCLKNVKFQAFSGSDELDQTADTTFWQPIPKESDAITLPFIYNMYSKKSKNGITTSRDDLPWSRNIKKAIADLFYVDIKVFDGITKFFRSENGFDYYVYSSEKTLNVTKMMSGDVFKTHIQETNDDTKLEDYFPLPIFRKFSYIIDPKTKNVKQIVAITNVEFNPLNGVSEKFQVLTNQTLLFKEERDSDLVKLDESNMAYTEIDFNMNAYLTDGGALDLSKGRIDMDMDKTVKELKRDLQRTFDYLNKSHITLAKTLINDDEHIDSVIRRLKYLDEKHLHDMYSCVADNEDLSKLLVEIVSLLGTPASCKFVVQMVAERKIVAEAVSALSDIPIHAISLPEDLKDQLLKLSKDHDLSENIRNQAVLTLSNFISKYVQTGDTKYRYNDIINNFIKALKESKEERDQLLYVYALSNIKTQKTYEELVNIARGVEYYNHLTTHTRAESLYGLQRSELEENLLWLMFGDKNEQFEIRAAILNILVTFDRPMNVEKMFWMLYNENDNDELKHLFYKKLVMLSECEMDQYDKTSTRASEFLSSFEKPYESYSESSAFFFESFDNNVGSAMEITYYGGINTHNFTTARLKMTSKLSSPASNIEEYYVYTNDDNLRGIDKSTAIPKILQSGIHLAKAANGRVLSFISFSLGTMILPFLTPGSKLLKDKMYYMNQKHRDEILVPTDMGVPVVYRNNAGFIAKIETRIEKDTKYAALFDLVYRSSEIYGFTSYNPISNTWNGIRRVMTADLKVGYDIDFNLDTENKNMKLTLNKNDEPSGFQSFVYSQVFTRDASNGEILKKTCPKCEMQNLISNGEDQLEGHVYLERDCEDTGSYYKFAVYDCEQRVTASYLSMTDLEQWSNLILASPTPGMCGIGFMMKKSEKYPATQLTINIGSTVSNDTPPTKTKLSYTVANAEKVIKTWDVILTNDRYNQSYAVMRLSAMGIKKGELAYKLCAETTEKWGRDYVTATTLVTAGSDDELNEPCPKDGSMLKIISRGEQSEEMKKINDPEKAFVVCDNDNSNKFDDCLREVSSYRHYTYDITFDNFKDEEVNLWRKVSDYLRLNYGDEFVRMRRQPNIGKNEMKVTIDYPVYYSSVNVSIMDHDEAYRYDDVEISDYYMYMYPAPYSTFTLSNDHFNKYCEAGAEYVTNKPNEDYRELDYDDDWAVLSKMEKDDVLSYLIKVKRVNKDPDSDLILYLQNDKDIAELSFNEDFELKINNVVMKMKPNVLMPIDDSFDVLMTNNDDTNHRVFVKMVDKTIAVEYTREKVRMSIGSSSTGECKAK